MKFKKIEEIMKEKIFAGNLPNREYWKLWLKKRLKLVLGFIFLQMLNFCFATLFALTFIQKDNQNIYLRYVYLSICLLIAIGISITWFFGYTTGGLFPRGLTEVYVDNDKLFISWTYKERTYSKFVIPNKVIVLEDHLYVEESRKNFAFLPKDVYTLVKEKFNK